jgi:hypothetical protein
MKYLSFCPPDEFETSQKQNGFNKRWCKESHVQYAVHLQLPSRKLKYFALLP